MAAHLARSHRLLAVDLRGYGDSDDEPVATGWDTFAGDVAAVHAHALGSDPADLVSESAGTPTLLTFRLSHPERVRSLTLIGPTLGGAADPARARHLHGRELPNSPLTCPRRLRTPPTRLTSGL